MLLWFTLQITNIPLLKHLFFTVLNAWTLTTTMASPAKGLVNWWKYQDFYWKRISWVDTNDHYFGSEAFQRGRKLFLLLTTFCLWYLCLSWCCLTCLWLFKIGCRQQLMWFMQLWRISWPELLGGILLACTLRQYS